MQQNVCCIRSYSDSWHITYLYEVYFVPTSVIRHIKVITTIFFLSVLNERSSTQWTILLFFITMKQSKAMWHRDRVRHPQNRMARILVFLRQKQLPLVVLVYQMLKITKTKTKTCLWKIKCNADTRTCTFSTRRLQLKQKVAYQILHVIKFK